MPVGSFLFTPILATIHFMLQGSFRNPLNIVASLKTVL